MKKLLIVESPAKAKTIGKYLGDEFTVKSSVGHVRDLPKRGGLAIDIKPVDGKDGQWTFSPSYEITADKKKVVAGLRAAAKAADEVYLAPDPDREGEAIAWHLKEVLSKETAGKKVARVTYNEITKTAVRNAVENPGEIDMARVDAQQARRILDRLVGYRVSPMLWRYLRYGQNLSAGRVQSVALRLIVEREREIKAFVPEPYWVLGVEAKKDDVTFQARLARIDGKKPEIKDAQTADGIAGELEGIGPGASLRVTGVKDQPKTRHPYPPFTTSTMQQAASSVCGLSPHRTMGLAQKLYEEGLITYMRTDSVNIAQSARESAAAFIETEYGKGFLPEKPNFYKSKSGAQEAHEAIRPTEVGRVPGSIEGLDAAAAKLYDLIWRRFVASQMADARFNLRTVSMEPAKEGLGHEYVFTASTTAVEFEGFLKAMPSAAMKKKQEQDDDSDEVGALPPLAEGDMPDVVRWLSERKETKPPSRFSEAALVKALEENGVGRPSTYAATIEVLVNRRYATRESRQLVPTQRGEDVNDWLVSRMPALFDVGYTAQMEGELDKVEEGEETGEKMLSGFYAKFLEWLDAAKDPPPSPEKFKGLFEMLEDVKTWQPAKRNGRRKVDDREFVDSLKEQVQNEPDQLTERQLRKLALLVAFYSGQIQDFDARFAALGWGDLAKRMKSAPPEDLVNDCFDFLIAAGALEGSKFLSSLQKQVSYGRSLSEKQFAALARSVCENSASGGDLAKSLIQRLQEFMPDMANVAAGGSAEKFLPEMVAMLGEIKTWRPVTAIGKRTYDDKEFAESLTNQFTRRKTLSPRQVAALKKLLMAYRTQIDDFDGKAEKYGIKVVPAERFGRRRRSRR